MPTKWKNLFWGLLILLAAACTPATNSSQANTEIIWVDNRNEVPVKAQDGRVEGDGAIITLGNVQRQEDGTAQVPGSIYVASLAGGGQTYILEQVNGRWAVTGNTGTLWIS